MNDVVERFERERWTAGVIGLGYVGLPLAVNAVNQGLRTIGFDVSARRIEQLAAGVSHVGDVSGEALSNALRTGLEVTDDPARLAEADAVFICVPSPLGRNRQPDMSYIEAAAATVAGIVRPGQLISLESTTYPGTTEDVIVPAVTGAGLTIDRDVYVAFSPERVSPGDEMKTGEIPKVVGGVSAVSGAVAAAAYRRLVPSVHLVSSAKAAEMAKLLENTYRAVNIGLINEMAQLAHELDIDIWEVVNAAATKPFGFQAFYPGPGVGGHCIPLDPQFLAWRAKEAKFATRFIDLAEQVNTNMPNYNASRIGELLNANSLPVRGTRILGIGISYKANVADDRESASLDVLRELEHRGASIGVFDPLFAADHIEALGWPAIKGTVEELGRFQLAVVLTDHDAFDFEAIADNVPLVFDAKDAFRRRRLARENVTVL